MIPCPHCDHPTDEHDVFCGACGAYLERGADPEVFRKTAGQVRKYIALSGLYLLGVLLIPVMAIGIFVLIEIVANWSVSAEMVAGAAISLIVYYSWGGIKGCRCPACGGFLPNLRKVLRHDRLSFCLHCGTRILDGNVPDSSLGQVREGDVCTHCGAPRVTGEGYCRQCGANFHAMRAIRWSACSRCGTDLPDKRAARRGPIYCVACGCELTPSGSHERIA